MVGNDLRSIAKDRRKTAGRALFAVLLSVVLASQAPADDTREKISQLLSDLNGLAARTDLTDEERAAEFLDLAEQGFDLDAMARAAIDPDLVPTEASWTQYLEAFRMHLAHAFIEGVRTYGPSRAQILGIRRPPDGAPVVFIGSADRQSERLDTWILCPGSEIKVCDVEVGGIRASARQRQDFSAVIERDGFDAFLEALRSGALVHL